MHTPTPTPAPTPHATPHPTPRSTPHPSPRSTRPPTEQPATPPPATRPVRTRRGPGHDDRGQATAEYGLVILVAGLIALGVIAWVRGTGVFTGLFESVIDTLTSAV